MSVDKKPERTYVKNFIFNLKIHKKNSQISTLTMLVILSQELSEKGDLLTKKKKKTVTNNQDIINLTPNASPN